jgi:transmembrane 9 superfamily protein 3
LNKARRAAIMSLMKNLFHDPMLAAILVLLLPCVTAVEYRQGDSVPVWLSTIGPYDNRYESYSYNSLPYCNYMKHVDKKTSTLGEALQGMEMIHSGMDIRFMRTHTFLT